MTNEKIITRTEKISTERMITRLLDDPDTTENLLRALTHRWQHSAMNTVQRQQLAPRVLELWQAFHSGSPADADPPPKITTRAEEFRLAVEKVLFSPKAIRSVLYQLGDRLDAGDYRGRDEPIRNGIAWLTHTRTHRRP